MLTFKSEKIMSVLGLPVGGAVEAIGADLAAEELVIQLFDQLHDRLLLYVRAFGLATQDSEDVLQETFLSLFQHVVRGRSRENLRGWLFRVAHNLALKRRSSMRLSAGARLEDYAGSQHDSGLTPHDLLEFKEQHSRYTAVLEALSEQDRCCLLLRAEGLKYREISALVGISLGSVATSLGRSLARFRRAAGR